jgi:hypothetical protein
MTSYTTQQNDSEFKQGISEMTSTDVCITYNARVRNYTLLNANEMKAQMIVWKTLKHALTIYEVNNKTLTFEGKTFYTMVLLPTSCDIEEDGADVNFCRLGMALGMLVSGYTYAFVVESNRDAVFKYLSKHIIIKQ